MTPISGILILVISIMATSSISSVVPSYQKCNTNEDCKSSSCCLLGPSRYALPSCMPYQQKGEQCRMNADTITTNLSYPDNSQIEVKDIHLILCPCADGLSCDFGICEEDA
ncbi:astakine [Solenopsis invicta]|uniref:astakine n=1 Tax=Solenopsis invicta TaxID=13686 RepID=UPI000E33E08A|nr:astakine [Solenopsis invicta]XP_039310997.1 astakine [Solenopsis invicta]